MTTMTIDGTIADELGTVVLDAIATARAAVVLPEGGWHGARAFRPQPDLGTALRVLRDAASMVWNTEAQLAIDTALLEQPAPPLRVVVLLEGGNVASVLCDQPAVVTTIDYDVEGIDPVSDPSFDIPQDDGTTSEALRRTFDADVRPAFITNATAAPLAMPVDLDHAQLCERWVTHVAGEYGGGVYSQQMPGARDKLSLFTASYAAADGTPSLVSFMLPGDDALGDRMELGTRAVETALGGSKVDAQLRGPVA